MSSPLLAAELALSPPALTLTPPLFEQTNIRKPEYWQFARLIAPSGSLPAGKKQWTADDAVGIWCLRCHRSLVFQKGSSQSIRYHMETKHRAELESFREAQTKEHALAATQQTTPSKKRRLDDTDDDATPRSGDTHVSVVIGSDPTAIHHVDDVPSTTTTTTTQAIGVHDLSTVPAASEGASTTPNALSSTADRPASTSTPSTVEWTWARNLQRQRGGFWADAHWYDVHLERRMPLVKPMLEELVAALPPCGGRHVVDLCAGSGRASAALLAAYPTANVTLVDASAERLALARQRILQQVGVHLADAQLVHTRIVPELLASLALPSTSPVDVVVGCLAFHVLAERPPHYEAQPHGAAVSTGPPASADAVYETLFRGVHALLQPGGHVLIADHVGQLGLYRHLALLERVGFEDVDCAWRQQDFFVVGARKPLLQTAVSM